MTLEAAVRAEAHAVADYDGAAAAVDFGDVAAEHRALAEGAALVWLPQRRIVRAGKAFCTGSAVRLADELTLKGLGRLNKVQAVALKRLPD